MHCVYCAFSSHEFDCVTHTHTHTHRFEYALPDTAAPRITRYCSIFRTLGDRRLADHVLRGLEILLPQLVPCTTAAGITMPEGVFGPRCAGSAEDEADATHMQYVCGGRENPDLLADLASVELKVSARITFACTRTSALVYSLTFVYSRRRTEAS